MKMKQYVDVSLGITFRPRKTQCALYFLHQLTANTSEPKFVNALKLDTIIKCTRHVLSAALYRMTDCTEV